MAIPPIPIVNELVGIGKVWLEGRQKKVAAKAELEAQLMSSKEEWEKYQAQASVNSWKDEYWTVILSLPILLAFVGVPICVFFYPEKLDILSSAINKQFSYLNALPEWYVWAIGASIGASFGFKGIKHFKKL